MSYSDQEIDYWADIFNWLEAVYGVRTEHRVSFELFMSNPAENERWVHIYFANPSLFTNRGMRGVILLPVFLENGPQYVLAGALEMKGRDVSALQEEAPLPLSPRQSKVQHLLDYLARYRDQEETDARIDADEMIMVHDNRYVQPMKQFYPISKFRIHGEAGR